MDRIFNFQIIYVTIGWKCIWNDWKRRDVMIGGIVSVCMCDEGGGAVLLTYVL